MKFIIYKGKLYCTKDVFDFVKSINIDNKKLEYFKKELLKILDKQENVLKSFSDMFDFIEKGRLANIGEVRTWNGVKYRKIASGKWRKFTTSNKGTGLAIASLKKEIDKCNNSQELLDLVLLHKERFYDNNGNPYPVVQELSDYVSKINDKLEKNENSEQQNKTKFYDKVIKTWANKKVWDEAYHLDPKSVKIKAEAKRLLKSAKTKAERKAANKLMEEGKIKSSEAIYNHYDNTPKEIGEIQEDLMVLFPNAKTNKIYCGAAHFIDHIVNHHPEMPLENYSINIATIINKKSDIYLHSGNRSINFVVPTSNNKLILVALKEDTNGNIVLWKTNYQTQKLTNSYKKINLANYSKVKRSQTVPAIPQISQDTKTSSALMPKIQGRSDNNNLSLDSDSVNKKNQSFNSVEAVKDFYKGTDDWLKAPNGKDTKLSEKQWCEVRTEQFKNWFGDWEKNKKYSSKILDENGEPLINYHGTSHQFDEFVSDEIGKTTNNKGIFGNGFYFSNSKEMANYYTKFDKTKEGKVLNTYLNIKKPFIWSDPKNVEVARKLGFPKDRIRDNKLLPLNDNEKIMKFTKKLKDAGYDGVIFNYPKNFSGYGDNNVNETVAFYPNQIKSANENDGNFSFNNNSINKSFSEMLNILLSHYDFLGGK